MIAEPIGQYLGGPLDGQDVGRGRSIYRLEDGSPCAPSHGSRRTTYGRWQPGERGIYSRVTRWSGVSYRWTPAPARRAGRTVARRTGRST
jgi:hypothetical protein